MFSIGLLSCILGLCVLGDGSTQYKTNKIKLRRKIRLKVSA